MLELERTLELGLELEPFDDSLVHLGLEHAVAALAVSLRHVHRDICVAEELLGVRGAEGPAGEADSDAGARIHLLRLDVERRLESGEHPGCNVGCLGRVLDAVEQNRELVAAEARHRVRRPNGDHEPLADLLQDGVSSCVTEAVVHSLEIVQIDEHDADGGSSAKGAHDRVLHAVGEQCAVREVRDGIVEGLVGELLLERLALAHIAAVQHDAPNVLVLKQVGVLHLELEPGPVTMAHSALDDVCLGSAACVGVAHAREDLDEPRPIRRSEQPGELCAFHLVRPIAERALDRRALVRHDAMCVENSDQVARMRNEGAEARLALPAVQIFGKAHSLDGERDLRAERLE